jgi:hypothetical protein
MSPKGKHLILEHVAVAIPSTPSSQGPTLSIHNQKPFARPTHATKRKSVAIIEHVPHKKEHIATWPKRNKNRMPLLWIEHSASRILLCVDKKDRS